MKYSLRIDILNQNYSDGSASYLVESSVSSDRNILDKQRLYDANDSYLDALGLPDKEIKGILRIKKLTTL